ncbi:MAG: M14 family zinc carboxypeptidase [Flammeovirgaceae bacterium]
MKQSLAKKLFEAYSEWVEPALQHRRFTSSTLKPLIESLANEPDFAVENIGYSEEHRNIYEVRYGHGPVKVLIWSQMHGDEPTGTMALFDLFNFLKTGGNEFVDFQNLKEQLSIYCIPMLNPDGAERFIRYNAFGIDLNRDAVRKQAKESQLLWERLAAIDPNFCFTLHDQERYYSTGRNRNIASMSFLANAVDFENAVPPHRKIAMQLIVEMNQVLQYFVPNQVGRYVDVGTYDVTAFGDSFQKAGYPSILFESGGYRRDWERMQPRKLNFMALLTAFYSIQHEAYTAIDEKAYFNIPENKHRLYDLILWNLTFKEGERTLLMDIGVNRVEKDERGQAYFRGELVNFGDLQNHNAYEEYDCTGMELRIGKVSNYNGNIEHTDFTRFHKEGITTLIHPFESKQAFVGQAINLTNDKNYRSPKSLKREMEANFSIWQGETIKYTILNGFLRDMEIEQGKIRNGLWVKTKKE